MRVLLQLGAGMLLLSGCPGGHSGQGDSASEGTDSNPDLPPGETVVFEGVAPGSAGESVAGAGDVDVDGYDDVAGVGDVDGDGFDDMLVGAALNAEEVGAAYLILGGADVASIGLGSADVKFTGASTGSWFGAGVSGAGDVNADGLRQLPELGV